MLSFGGFARSKAQEAIAEVVITTKSPFHGSEESGSWRKALAVAAMRLTMGFAWREGDAEQYTSLIPKAQILAPALTS